MPPTAKQCCDTGNEPFPKTSSVASPFSTHALSTRQSHHCGAGTSLGSTTRTCLGNQHTKSTQVFFSNMTLDTHRPSLVQSVGGMQMPSTRTTLWQTSAVRPARSAAARQSGRDNPVKLPMARRLFRRGSRHTQRKSLCPVQPQACGHRFPSLDGTPAHPTSLLQ